MARPIAEQRFAVVDVETSGLRPTRHRLLQVGVVVVDGSGAVLQRWSSLVAPKRRWFFRVGPTHIHGIRRRDLRGAPRLHEVLREMAPLLQDAQLVAHNATFDVQFLQRAAQTAGVALPLQQPLCTLRMSRRLDPDRTMRHRLGDLCQRYDITLAQPHHALSDAAATAEVLPHLLRAHQVDTDDELRSLLVALQDS
jgi:DNA polymerase-3 subunit epsilon